MKIYNVISLLISRNSELNFATETVMKLRYKEKKCTLCYTITNTECDWINCINSVFINTGLILSFERFLRVSFLL